MLLYTAITRAKKMLLIVASGNVMALAAGRGQTGKRLTGLVDRLGRAAAQEGLERRAARVFRDEGEGAVREVEGEGGEQGGLVEGVDDGELKL